LETVAAWSNSQDILQVLGDRGDLDPEQRRERALGKPGGLVAEQHADLHRIVGRAVEQELGLTSGDFRHRAISGAWQGEP
jgi:hypothetical protein